MTLIIKLKFIKSDIFNTYTYRNYFNKYKCIFIHIPKAAGSIILNNIEIGDNSVIAAGSVVTKDIEKNVVVAGIPAKKIRDINE